MKLSDKLKDEDIIRKVGKVVYLKENVRFLHNDFVDEENTSTSTKNNTYVEELTEEELLLY